MQGVQCLSFDLLWNKFSQSSSILEHLFNMQRSLSTPEGKKSPFATEPSVKSGAREAGPKWFWSEWPPVGHVPSGTGRPAVLGEPRARRCLGAASWGPLTASPLAGSPCPDIVHTTLLPGPVDPLEIQAQRITTKGTPICPCAQAILLLQPTPCHHH